MMFTPWYETDSDCAQYMRNDGNMYEMIQAVWLDTTEDDIALGGHEYCIVQMGVDLELYSREEKESYLSAYGYTLDGLDREYFGDEEAINSIVAECILETEILSDAYVIADADTFFEANEKIKKIIERS